MKHLLLPLLAAFALPTAANAETFYLIYRDREMKSVISIPMESMEQCELSGSVLTTSKKINAGLTSSSDRKGFECIEGK